MKKLFSAVIIVMMIALAGTLAVSAAEVYSPNAEGLYNIEHVLTGTVEDGTQFGMVVIETTGDEAFALDEATIRYIDQVAAADGALTFDAFAPMDLKSEGTYKVYIGGGALEEATFIGTLSTETVQEPTVTSVTLAPTTATINVDETVTLTATVNDGLTPALTWESDDEDVATVENGVVTGIGAGTAIITVTAAEGVTATATITVEEVVVSDRVPGNANVSNNVVDAMDSLWILRHLAGHTLNNFNESNADCQNHGNGINAMDSLWILRYLAGQNVTLE